MRRFLVACVLGLSFAAVAETAFPLEWALLTGAARTRLVGRLTEEGRTNEVSLLRALAEEDAATAESVLRRMTAERDEPRLAEGLVRLVRASGRAAEAQELERGFAARRPRCLAAAPSSAPAVNTNRTPVVFLHGYSGGASTWSDFLREFRDHGGYTNDDVIVFQYYSKDDSSSGLDAGLTDFGWDADAKIEDIAARVEDAVTVWLRRRADFINGGSSSDGRLPAADWVCHSMGGLVLRNVLRDRPELVRRCVTLGTPHFGQAVGGNGVIGRLAGVQAQQMSFGSSTLWNLAADWRFLGRRTDDILFVAGVDSCDDGLYHDGLICAFSATMQTAEDPDFARNTYFVNRIHSTALSLVYEDTPALTQLSADGNDPLFRLVCGYLNDSGSFADGRRPSQLQVLSDEIGVESAQSKLSRLVKRGALFVQVMDGATNTAERLERPVRFDPGYFYPDAVVEDLLFASGCYENRDDGLIRENGSGDEGCTNGLVLLYGDIPTGDCHARIGRPSKTTPEYAEYTDCFHLAGGGTTTVRTRPGAARPLSAVPVADGDGTVRSVVVSNDWLAAHGFAASAEDLAGCLAAASADGSNGCPAAVSFVLGLDPADPDSNLRISSLAVGEALVFGVSAGDRALRPGVDPVVLQSSPDLKGDWQDASTTGGDWTLPRTDARFFRAVLHW